MAKAERFEEVYSQGVMSYYKILRDRETGVEYLFAANGSAGGLTPLLSPDGKPIVSSWGERED